MELFAFLSADELAPIFVFAAIMIVCNGVVGLCLVVGGLRHGVMEFRVEGTSPALASIGALAGLALVLPSFTTTTGGPTYSGSQLAFAGITSLRQQLHRMSHLRNQEGLSAREMRLFQAARLAK